jgi:hypothetical protein
MRAKRIQPIPLHGQFTKSPPPGRGILDSGSVRFFGRLEKSRQGRPFPPRKSIHIPELAANATMQTPFVYLISGFSKPSPRVLIAAGLVSLIVLAVFLRIKLG